jgi:hypothetical protein
MAKVVPVATQSALVVQDLSCQQRPSPKCNSVPGGGLTTNLQSPVSHSVQDPLLQSASVWQAVSDGNLDVMAEVLVDVAELVVVPPFRSPPLARDPPVPLAPPDTDPPVAVAPPGAPPLEEAPPLLAVPPLPVVPPVSVEPPVVTAPPVPVALLLLGLQAAAQRPASKASRTTRVLVWKEAFI